MKAKPVTKSRKYGRYHGNHIEKALVKRVKKDIAKEKNTMWLDRGEWSFVKPEHKLWNLLVKDNDPKKYLQNIRAWYRVLLKCLLRWPKLHGIGHGDLPDVLRLRIRRLRYAKSL